MSTWGVIPAAGVGSRIQPLAFSKELLPVGSQFDATGVERPRAVSEYLVERMLKAGATRICFVISPGKADILAYYGAQVGRAAVVYVVQNEPAGLCDAIFRALPLISREDTVLVGLPDTVWFPLDGFTRLDDGQFSLLLFQVDRPQLFDAVILSERGDVLAVQVKPHRPGTDWVWGAIKMRGVDLYVLHELWLARRKRDEYLGTLVNEFLIRGGTVRGERAGEGYVDVGTLHGYREAIALLSVRSQEARTPPYEHASGVRGGARSRRENVKHEQEAHP